MWKIERNVFGSKTVLKDFEFKTKKEAQVYCHYLESLNKYVVYNPIEA